MIYKIFRIVFVVWVALWIGFFARELFVKNNIRDYKALLSRPLDGKHAYLMGEKLYEFLVYCGDRMPPGATYRIVGIGEGSLERRRAVYYMYPHVENARPDFIIDAERFIITKAGG